MNDSKEPHALSPGQYLSVSSPIDAEMSIQRSKFIASLRRAENRALFDEELKRIMNLHPKATHYCWAYRFQGEPVTEHSSDAGEPTGTAGRPILGALKKHALLNIVAVVTRYFGGVKLGVKGLIEAYRQTTLLAIEHAQIITAEPASLLIFRCEYGLYDIFLSCLERLSCDVTLLHPKFEDIVRGEIQIPTSLSEQIAIQLDSLASGKTSFSYSITPLNSS
jgi:uncharacterized YigZ family protein